MEEEAEVQRMGEGTAGVAVGDDGEEYEEKVRSRGGDGDGEVERGNCGMTRGAVDAL